MLRGQVMSKTGKRTPGLETTQSIINKTIHGLGKNFARKYYAHVILWNWNKIVGNAIGNNVEPQGLRGDTLYLYCYDPSLRQELRLLMLQMIQKINNFVGMALVKKLALVIVGKNQILMVLTRFAWQNKFPN